MNRLPLDVQTLYSEMLEQALAHEAQRTIGHLSGLFVTKSVKGNEYYYFQYFEPGGKKRQVYVGRRDDALDAVVARFAESKELVAADTESLHRLAAALRAGGAQVTDTASARVLKALSDSGVFRLGGVLVGTHAFLVLGNLLGVRWSGAALRTQDIDLAAARTLSVGIPDAKADVPTAIESLEMGFLPVPGLDPRTPSTSFKVRGQGLRVDVLTPAERDGGGPVQLARFGAAAQPLRFLDYLIETPVAAVVIDGGGVLVNVPDPARFALHKLLVAAERPAVAHAKRDKDLSQAAQVLEVLVEERPGDVRVAWEACAGRGPGWARRLRAGLETLTSRNVGTAARVLALVDPKSAEELKGFLSMPDASFEREEEDRM